MAEIKRPEEDGGNSWSMFADSEIAEELKFWQRAIVRLGVLLNGAGIAACLGALGALANSNGPPKIIVLPIGVFLFGIFAGLLVGLGNIMELFWEAGKREMMPDRRPKNPIVTRRFSIIVAAAAFLSFGCFALGAIIGLGLILAL